jgi:hypothetical protein
MDDWKGKMWHINTMEALLSRLKKERNAEWWYTPVVPVLGRLTQEDHEFKASLRSCLKNRERKETPTYAIHG